MEDKERRKRLISLWIIALIIALIIGIASRNLSKTKRLLPISPPPQAKIMRPPKIEIKPMPIPPRSPHKDSLAPKKAPPQKITDKELKRQVPEGMKIEY